MMLGDRPGVIAISFAVLEILLAGAPQAPEGIQEAVPALVKSLEHEDPRMREHAATTLGSLGPSAENAVSALVSKLTDPEPRVRRSAAWALGEIGPAAARAVPALTAASRDQNAEVRGAARSVLEKIRRR